MATRFPAVGVPHSCPGAYWVYILQSGDLALYIGQSNNVVERLRKHRQGLGSKHTRDHPKLALIFVEGPYDLDRAVSREAQLKRWSRAKKEALISGDTARLRALSHSCG